MALPPHGSQSPNFRSAAVPVRTILGDSPSTWVKVNNKSLSKRPESRLMPTGIGEYSSIRVKSTSLSLSSSVASRFLVKGRNLPLRASGAPLILALKCGSTQAFLVVFKVGNEGYPNADFGDFLLTLLEPVDKFEAAAFDRDITHRKHGLAALGSLGVFMKSSIRSVILKRCSPSRTRRSAGALIDTELITGARRAMEAMLRLVYSSSTEKRLSPHRCPSPFHPRENHEPSIPAYKAEYQLIVLSQADARLLTATFQAWSWHIPAARNNRAARRAAMMAAKVPRPIIRRLWHVKRCKSVIGDMVDTFILMRQLGSELAEF